MYHKKTFLPTSSLVGLCAFSFLCFACGGDDDNFIALDSYLVDNDIRADYYALPVEQQNALENYYTETRGEQSFAQVVRAAKNFKNPLEYIPALVSMTKNFTLTDAQRSKMFTLFPQALQLKVLSRQNPSVVFSLLNEQESPPTIDVAWIKDICDLLEGVEKPEVRSRIIKKSYPTDVLKAMCELNANDLEKVLDTWADGISEHKLRALSRLPERGDWSTREYLVECMEVGATFSPQQMETLLSMENFSAEKKNVVLGLATVPGIEKLEGKYFERIVNSQISAYASENPRYAAILAAELLNNRGLDDDKKGLLINMKGPAIEFLVRMFPRYTFFTIAEFKIIAEVLSEQAIVDKVRIKMNDARYRAGLKPLLDFWDRHVSGISTYDNNTIKAELRNVLT